MKTILEVKFSGECKAPVLTTRRGKHLFCGEPTPEGASYCRECGQRMVLPTRHYADSASQADMFGGGKAKAATNENHVNSGAFSIVPVDRYVESSAGFFGNNRDAARAAAYISRFKVVA